MYQPFTIEIRSADLETDRNGLWRLKRQFELGLGTDTGGEHLVGYIIVLPESLSLIWDGGVVNELFVAEPHRGTGVADRLMERALEVLSEQDLPLERVVLNVDRANDRAQAFYERYGFDHWGELVSRPLE